MKYSMILIAASILIFGRLNYADTDISRNKTSIIICTNDMLTDPPILLTDEEEKTLLEMIAQKKENSTRIPDREDLLFGQGHERSKYDAKGLYRGINIINFSNDGEYQWSFYIVGKYIRTYRDRETKSILEKMKDRDIEKYLIELADKKNAFRNIDKDKFMHDLSKVND